MLLNMKKKKKNKKFCNYSDRKRELYQMLTAAVSGGEITCGLNSWLFFSIFFRVSSMRVYYFSNKEK